MSELTEKLLKKAMERHNERLDNLAIWDSVDDAHTKTCRWAIGLTAFISSSIYTQSFMEELVKAYKEEFNG